MNKKIGQNLAPATLDRRGMLKGTAAMALATLLLADILADPALAQEPAPEPVQETAQEAAGEAVVEAAQVVATGTTMVSLTTEGGRQVSGALALPENLNDGEAVPSVLLVHEWWGLNDQIKALARTLADEGYLVLAVDLYDGVVATDAATARFQSRNVDPAEAVDTLTSWGTWLRAHEASTEKLGTCGRGFGGGWSLRASLNMTVDATVIYYGNVARSAEELRNLQGPVIGHFGSRDMYINEEMVAGFENELTKAGRVATLEWYDADHDFANAAATRYDEEDAKIAWDRTLAFFKTYLNTDT